jgi:hypothetical protein
VPHPFAGHQVVIAADRLHLLNPSAALLWEGRKAGLDETALADRLTANYGLTPTTARVAVDQTLADWRRTGLLDTSNPPVAPFPPPPPPAIHDPPPSLRHARIQDYRLFDQRLRVRCADLALWAMIAPPFAHLAVASTTAPEPAATFSVLAEPTTGLSLWRGGWRLAEALNPNDALLALFGEIAEFGYRERHWLTALHAAAIHHGQRALVLPALGGAGKTTLTAALLAAGFGYLSDDVAPLDAETLEVWPLPLPLRIKPGSVALLRTRYPELDCLPAYGPAGQAVRLLPPPRFDPVAAGRRYPVAGLVFPDYRPGAAATVQPLPPLEALQRLITTEALLRRPLIPEHIERLLAWLEATPAWRLKYDDLATAVRAIRELP